MKTEHGVWKIDPIYNDKEQALYQWFETYNGGYVEDHRNEVYEHHLVTPYMATKLREEGEQVVELYGLDIWCRTTTGMSYLYDSCIVSIYNKLISK